VTFPRLIYNRLSYSGLAIAALSFLSFLFLVVFHTVAGAGRRPYAGLLIFVAVPAVLAFGLLLVPVGMGLEWLRWRQKETRPLPVFPVIDLNDARHRNATIVFLAGSIVLLFLFVFSSYQGYHYTESVAFCGTLCHSVMKPEYTTYQESPHARVACVECHVGPGADWFVRSKLSGVPQIFYTLTDSYPRPIQTPVKNLRPAQETCEQCHWPEAFFGGQEERLIHFLPDESNTRWEINLLIKTGGGSPETSRTEGIHWHMNIGNRLEYIATDEKLQSIRWVRITTLGTGETREYYTGKPLSKEEIAKAKIHRMDCIDCHNRPTHIFRSPVYSVNLALAKGDLDATLPYIKREAVKLLAPQYVSDDEARKAIRDGLTSFYGEKYPDLAKTNPKAISDAVVGLQDIFAHNEFPAMKVRWDTHPDNIGHIVSLGCDRCHDGEHRDAEGKAITNRCTACHSILSEGKMGSITYSNDPQGLVFKHPVDIGEAWKETLCSDCHTGAGGQ
jgi:nitrate/TMAO reductase-like tetraheme cytochrome c subunit